MLALTWVVVVLSFFVLAVQLFVTLLEFKLTTLAGFVLVPFALWNKTTFLAEKVLGNVVSSGIKVLVLAVIVGIGTGLFAQFQTAPAEPSIDHALVVMLASLSLLGLGIFGPGIATGLVSGAPQLFDHVRADVAGTANHQKIHSVLLDECCCVNADCAINAWHFSLKTTSWRFAAHRA